MSAAMVEWGKRKMIRKFWILVALIAGGALIGALFLRRHQTVIFFPGAPTLSVSVADTEPLREKGLSGKRGLRENEGMLFIFEIPGQYGFWMKDMRFAIDIVWIDSDWTIVDITENATPESFPATFSPVVPAQYVVEVPAGYARAHHLSIGQSVGFERH